MFFNATGIDTTSQFDAIPAGDYDAIVTASELKATKDGAGQYLELTLEIQSGPCQGRRLWDRLNISNRNPKAVEIAQRQLAQLCHAVGVLELPTDATPLHNRAMVVKVTAKHDGERGLVNEIKGYKARAAVAQPAAAPFQAPRVAQPAAPAAFGAPAPAAGAAPFQPWATARTAAA